MFKTKGPGHTNDILKAREIEIEELVTFYFPLLSESHTSSSGSIYVKRPCQPVQQHFVLYDWALFASPFST